MNFKACHLGGGDEEDACKTKDRSNKNFEAGDSPACQCRKFAVFRLPSAVLGLNVLAPSVV